MNNLANLLRPKKLNQIIGQKKVVAILKKMAQNKLHNSLIFFGEAGVGKTSAAVALANELGLTYQTFNASVDSKKDLLEKLNSSEILIIDEIHRLNKDKQDILLSYLEFDKIIVYATTTENPYFKVNPALRSRMQIFQFDKLTEEEMFEGLQSLVKTSFKDLTIDSEVLEAIVKISNGDYRFCVNTLQTILLINNKQSKIALKDIEAFLPSINFYSDENSSSHYNNLSAFHKSLRGSDVDAALYYAALILKTGDYLGLYRRLTAAAYEDVGLSEPNIPLRVEAAFQAVERLGFPEAKLPLYFAIISVALAPKSNSVYKSISNVESFIEKGNVFEVPKHLRDAHYSSAIKIGDGIGYKYPHDFPKSIVKQTYLPNKIINKNFFESSENDNKKIIDYYNLIKKTNKKGDS